MRGEPGNEATNVESYTFPLMRCRLFVLVLSDYIMLTQEKIPDSPHLLVQGSMGKVKERRVWLIANLLTMELWRKGGGGGSGSSLKGHLTIS